MPPFVDAIASLSKSLLFAKSFIIKWLIVVILKVGLKSEGFTRRATHC
jgi:hypothetical protein